MSDTPPQGDQNQNDPAQLRSKLDKAHQTLNDKDAEIRRLTIGNRIFEAGLGHLNEHQRNAVVNGLAQDQEPTVDALKTTATNLGFPETPTPPPPPPSQPNSDASQGQNQNQPPAEPGQPNFVPEAPNSWHPDPRVQSTITGLTQQEYAHIQALRGGSNSGDFEEALAKTNSKKEVLEVIRNLGADQGLLLDSDLT